MHSKPTFACVRPGIYLVADVDYLAGRPAVEVVAQAVAGGVTVVQLRAKHLGGRSYLELAQAVHVAIKGTGVPLLLNDRADVALAAGVEGVHIGQQDLPAHAVRAMLGPKAIIGLSVETMHQVHQARHLPVDYLAASPVFATPTKPDTAAAWGLAGLAQVCAVSQQPVCAIGGIQAGNLPQVLSQGVYWAAVVSAICGASHVEQAARDLASQFTANAAFAHKEVQPAKLG